MRVDAAKVFLLALWVVCVYRAVTQSIVHDEALTWELYLAGPASAIFNYFDANHHFLNTILMRLTTGAFGLSEFSMRLPALAGAALCFAAVYRIARRVSSRWPLVLLTCAVLTLNPLVLDFMVAARGYGMALALWLWAFAVLLPALSGEGWRKRDLIEAAIAVSLSVMANLIFVLPAAMFAACVVVAWLRGARKAPEPPRPSKKKERKIKAPAVPSVWLWFAAPVAACAAMFWLISPLNSARGGDFYVGYDSLADSVRNMVTVSLFYAPWTAHLPGVAFCRNAIGFVVGPAIVIAALVIGVRRRDALLLVPAVAAAGSALLIALAHLTVGMLWPMDRTTIDFAMLVTLCLVALAARVSASLWAAVGVVVLVFAAQFNLHSFYCWRYDADTRTIANQIAQRKNSNAPESVQVDSSWQLEPALNFYRVKDNWTWMQPVERRPVAPGAAFYALISDDSRLVRALHLRVVYKGPRSASVLALPQ